MKKLKIFSILFALVTLFTSCEEQPIVGQLRGLVETKEATEITTTSAKLNGEVTRKGDLEEYYIGFLMYSGAEEDFKLETNGVQQIQCDKSEGAFSKTIDNLNVNKTYKFRAYITSGAGTNYGEVKTFTTKKEIVKGEVTTNIADQITNNSARLNGQIVNTGNSSNYTKGFVLYTGNLNTFTLETSGVTNIVSSTSGNTFNAIANNLTQGKTYKFRAYIKNEAGESYGEVKTFIAKDAVVAGQVTTNDATEITSSQARLNGDLVSSGNSTNYTIGFLLYSGNLSTFTETTSGVQKFEVPNSKSLFNKLVTNLTELKSYNFRTYITNEVGTNYGSIKTFTTPTAVTLGQVTTNDATNITTTTATLKGVLNSTGNSTNYTVGFLLYQGSASNFTLTTSGVQNYTTTASGTTLSKALTNLNGNTNYKFRTYITNEAGTSYGDVKTFTTEEEIPEMSFVCLQTLTGHTDIVNSASYSPDGTKIVSASDDGTIKIWDANTGTCLRTLTGHSYVVSSASYSPDGTKIVSASQDWTIKIWNANTGACLQTLTGNNGWVFSASYSPDGTKIVSASVDNTIKIWNANTGTCLQTLTGHTDNVLSASYSPDGTRIVSASYDHTIKIWDANTGTCLRTLTGYAFHLCPPSYSPDGTKIVSASVDNTIKIWDANTGSCLQTLTGHTWSVNSASYSPDGTKIVSASGYGDIKIWNANTGTCLQTLTGHTYTVESASYSPDGTKIVSASTDDTIKIWGLE